MMQAIRRQKEGGLAREVLEEQLQMGWPGLAQEVSQICKCINLPDASRRDLDKEDIKKAVQYDHLKSLKLQLKGKELEQMANSDVSTRRAWSLLECRMANAWRPRCFSAGATCPRCTAGT